VIVIIRKLCHVDPPRAEKHPCISGSFAALWMTSSVVVFIRCHGFSLPPTTQVVSIRLAH